MKKITVLLLVSFSCLFSFSQGYINAKRSKCKKGLQEFLTKNNYSTPVIETDSTLELHAKDPGVRPFDLVLYFNAKGKCIKNSKKWIVIHALKNGCNML